MNFSSTTFLDRANNMVLYGVPVVPLPPCKKDPPPKGFKELATTDCEIIRGWLVPNGKPAIAFKDSNCACVARPDGVWFLDIDNVAKVAAAIEKATGHRLDEIKTLIVKSSGEKRHLYFNQNEASRSIGNFSYKDSNDAEIFSARVNGMYVVSPFSIHPDTGNEYEIISNADITEAPAWLTDFLKTAKRETVKRNNEQASDDTAKIAKGGRDEFLFSEACKLRDTKVDQKAALAALQVINRDRCEPPLPDSVVLTKVGSAYTREARVPAVVSRATEVKEVPHGITKSFLTETADKIRMKQVRWVWRNRIAEKLNLAVGDPGEGKSLFTLYCAARITTGSEWFDADSTMPIGEVAILSAEDDWDDTVVPRLVAAGADLSKVHHLQMVSVTNGPGKTQEERDFQLDTDTKLLQDFLTEHPNVKMVVVDPVTNYLGANTKMMDDMAVRRVLMPLKGLSEKLHLSIIAIMHLNKKVDLNAIYRIGGSMAFVGVARMVWLFAKSPTEEERPESKDEFLMLRVKGNIVARDIGGLKYEIKTKPVRIEGEDVFTPYLNFTGSVDKDPSDLAPNRGDSRPAHRPAEKLPDAIAWLAEFLKDGPKARSEVIHYGRENSFSEKTLDRAKTELKLTTFPGAKEKGRDGKMYKATMWKLSGEEEPMVI